MPTVRELQRARALLEWAATGRAAPATSTIRGSTADYRRARGMLAGDDLAAGAEPNANSFLVDCPRYGTVFAEKNPEDPDSGAPPLVWNDTDPNMARRRRDRPTVGFAQRHLNRFLERLGEIGPDALCPAAAPRVKAFLDRVQAPLKVDCIFGPQTELVTKAFQACAGLEVDGKIGPKTWQALLNFPSFVDVESPATTSVSGFGLHDFRVGAGGPKTVRVPFRAEISAVATFERPKSWGVKNSAKGNAVEKRLLTQGTWHPTTDDLLAVAETPNQGRQRTEVITVTDLNGLLSSMAFVPPRTKAEKKDGKGAERPDGSIRRFNIMSHGNSQGVVGLTGRMDDSGNVFFLPNTSSDPLDAVSLTPAALSFLNEQPLCALRDKARAKFAPDGEIALILCNGGSAVTLGLMQDLARTFNVRVRAYKQPIFFKPNFTVSPPERDITSLTENDTSPSGRGYPTIIDVPDALAGRHLEIDDKVVVPKPKKPLSCAQ